MSTSSFKSPRVVGVVSGLAWSIFGLNGFLHFLPQPAVPGAAGQFLGALAGTGYMFALIKGTELAAGLLLLSNRFVPLALTLLAPVLVNIVAFHAFLAPAGLAVPLALLAAELFLAWSYRDAFAPMLQAHGVPQGPVEARGSFKAHATA
jgi:hypothetical protein